MFQLFQRDDFVEGSLYVFGNNRYDPETLANYPATGNRCCTSGVPNGVAPEHQQDFGLQNYMSAVY